MKNVNARRRAVAEAGVFAVAKVEASGVNTNSAMVRRNMEGVK
jgi:hypothetical protein